jgi:small subunit ribosomal protein S8e
MGRWQGRSLTKPTGGRIWARRKKRKREMGSDFIETKIGPTQRVLHRVKGGGVKCRLSAADVANVVDPATGRARKAKILTVVENPADPHFVRRNVLTRGAVIETEIGRARVTSRPGQDGVINAILLETAREPEAKPTEAPASAEGEAEK